MRCDQPQGLPVKADQFLELNEVPPKFCECCKRAFPKELEQIGTYAGFDKHSLFRHILRDGRTADEFLQHTEWSSGPMMFLGLKVSDGTKFEWTEKEIQSFFS